MKTRLQGFTMIELLISMALGLALVAGISDMFLRFQKTSNVQRNLSYMMEDGRYVLEIMSKEIRSTGFLRNRMSVITGTTTSSPVSAHSPPWGGTLLRNKNNLAITATEYCDSRADVGCPVFLQDPQTPCTASCTGVLGSTGASTTSAGVNLIGINFAAPVITTTETSMEVIKGISGDAAATDLTASDSFAIRYQLNDSQDLQAGTAAGENSSSPCTVDIHLTMHAGAGANGLLDENPAAPVATTPTGLLGAQVNVVTIYFYVANDSDGIPTLYCRAKRENQFTGNSSIATTPQITTAMYTKMNPGVSTTPSGQPLIPNVYRMVVEYGVALPATTGAPAYLYYTEAKFVTDWTKVVAVKLYLVLRTEDNATATQAATYMIENQVCSSVSPYTPFRCPPFTTSPLNQRLYRVFSTTIAFRN